MGCFWKNLLLLLLLLLHLNLSHESASRGCCQSESSSFHHSPLCWMLLMLLVFRFVDSLDPNSHSWLPKANILRCSCLTLCSLFARLYFRAPFTLLQLQAKVPLVEYLSQNILVFQAMFFLIFLCWMAGSGSIWCKVVSRKKNRHVGTEVTRKSFPGKRREIKNYLFPPLFTGVCSPFFLFLSQAFVSIRHSVRRKNSNENNFPIFLAFLLSTTTCRNGIHLNFFSFLLFFSARKNYCEMENSFRFCRAL